VTHPLFYIILINNDEDRSWLLSSQWDYISKFRSLADNHEGDNKCHAYQKLIAALRRVLGRLNR
jgi:hypothetical protein